MRSTMRITALFVALACGWSWAAIGFAQVAEPTKKAFDPHYLSAPHQTTDFLALDGGCYQCHRTDQGNTPQPSRPESLTRITFRETNKWREQDFHDQAGIALTTPRAKAMSDLLGYDVSKSTQCLGCHTGTQKVADQAGKPPHLTAPEQRMVLEHGVSCQACHGPAKNWDGPHRTEADWWKNSSDKKYAIGLLDVRRPTTRAQICLSCHLGSSAEGKIITHEMYAAGHPPLGNFEVENFMNAMPFHGMLLEDKTKSSEPSHGDWYRRDDFYRTRSVLTASIVALRMQVQLLLDETSWSANSLPSGNAADGKPTDAYRARWPELAHFNCASCHHELASDRLAPDRSASAAPGRPLLRSWPTVLYEVAMLGSGLDKVDCKPAEPLMQPLEAALARNPFGRSKDVHAAAQAIAARLDRELAAFDERPIDRVAAKKFLATIATVGLSRRVDYEEARQSAWAARAIVKELKDAKADADDDAAVSAAVEPIVAGFSTELKLDFAAKPAKKDPRADFHKVEYSPALLKWGSESLKKSVDFDESAYRVRLEKLKKAISANP
jgi:mono/diheme cytochrome c family protein